MTRPSLGLILLLAASPAAAQSAGQWHGPEEIWAASCGYCHGTTHAPEIRGQRLSVDTITTAVRHGAPGMPVFHPTELSDAEVTALAKWIEASPPPAKEK